MFPACRLSPSRTCAPPLPHPAADGTAALSVCITARAPCASPQTVPAGFCAPPNPAVAATAATASTWHTRTNQNPISLHPHEVPAASVPAPHRWHVSSGIAHPAHDGTPWCRIPHTALCPAHPASGPLTPQLAELRRRLALRTRRLLDAGAFTHQPPNRHRHPTAHADRHAQWSNFSAADTSRSTPSTTSDASYRPANATAAPTPSSPQTHRRASGRWCPPHRCMDNSPYLTPR
ncbi:DUF6083 domain-containing protein [Streptomyces sp. NBRC 110611]|uniref:DUF6083 domain-containing protein n=1 Tax=Streptomyces sp. NBRC 110611 TaxID=1621259 RepID=UPI002852793C|nr:DUF6083 domain-containing protein [Streptomyces sp. NBRC 110611]